MTCMAPRTPASGFLTSWAITAAISPSRASDVCSRSCSSIRTRALRSCRMPVNLRSPPTVIFPTDRWSGNVRAVPAQAGDLPPGPDDLLHSRREMPREIGVVLFVIGRRHEHVDVAADHLTLLVAEQAFGRRVERLDSAVRVDDDDAIHGRVDDRPPPRLAGPQLVVEPHALR